MKRNLTALFLAGLVALSLCGCGGANTDTPAPEDSTPQETPDVPGESPAEQPETPPAGGDTFSFAELKGLRFVFSSGAGGWATMLTIQEDGSFSGQFFDGELDVTGEGYPNGTMYQSNFTGQFSQPAAVNDYTWAMEIQELTYQEALGTEEIRDGTLYCYSTAYGLDDAERILLYLLGAPLAELPEEYRSWVGYYDLSTTPDTELPFWGLYNEAAECGFSSYSVLDNLTAQAAAAEEAAAALEDSIRNDPLTQTEYNEKTGQLYEVWDSLLNTVWGALKQTLDPDAMAALTAEERAWIAEKEQAVTEAGAAYEGGSMQPMVMNQKAAELTRERVYQLLELFQ